MKARDLKEVVRDDEVPVPASGDSLDELLRQVKVFLGGYRSLTQEAMVLRRKSSVQLFFAGLALIYIRAQLIEQGIPRKKWLKDNGIPRRTADEAEVLAKRAKTVDAVKDLTPSEAKRKFGIYPAKKERATKTAVPRSRPRPEPNTTPRPPRKPQPELSVFNPDDRTGVPDKEAPSSLRLLAKAVSCLRFCEEAADLAKAEEYRGLIEDAFAAVDRIRQKLGIVARRQIKLHEMEQRHGA